MHSLEWLDTEKHIIYSEMRMSKPDTIVEFFLPKGGLSRPITALVVRVALTRCYIFTLHILVCLRLRRRSAAEVKILLYGKQFDANDERTSRIEFFWVSPYKLKVILKITAL